MFRLGERQDLPKPARGFPGGGTRLAEVLWKFRTTDAESKADTAALPTAMEEGGEQDLEIH